MFFVLVLLQDSLLCDHRACKARWVTQVARLPLVKASLAQARTGRCAPQAAAPLTVMHEETKHGHAHLAQSAITCAGRVHRVSATLGDYPAPLRILSPSLSHLLMPSPNIVLEAFNANTLQQSLHLSTT